MHVTIEESTLRAAHMSPGEFKREIALHLYEQDRMTLGQAAELAEMSQYRFQHMLAARGIPAHYGLEEFESDLTTLHGTTPA